MAILQWTIICERAIIEEQTKTVSLMSMVENITLPLPPADFAKQVPPPLVPFRFYVVLQFARSKPGIGERAPGRVLMIAPNEKQFGESEFVVDLTATPRARVILQTIGFPLMGAGLYRSLVQMKVRTQWRKAGQAEFGVVFTEQPVITPRRRH